ncbi:MAG TPA: helix-turn-helix transcriptional regulator [Bacteroidales bacterium]|nr:helix-turn-helix transcriptional regulator [Bacteroidales bacterium]
MDGKDALRKLMPLTETSFYILISLLEPLHGYGIMQKVERLSGGRILFGPGTLYGAINNLESIGLIIMHGQVVSSNKKKTYLVSAKGRALINLEIERLKEMVKNAEMLLGESSKDL